MEQERYYTRFNAAWVHVEFSDVSFESSLFLALVIEANIKIACR